jgi:hypothetical protein
MVLRLYLHPSRAVTVCCRCTELETMTLPAWHGDRGGQTIGSVSLTD